jgi:hypothetical protein
VFSLFPLGFLTFSIGLGRKGKQKRKYKAKEVWDLIKLGILLLDFGLGLIKLIR